MTRPWIPVLATLLALGSGAASAHAAAEVFSNFDVQFQEEDDESLMDHFLTRAPLEWRHSWEFAPSAVRTSQGCLTSGQWFINTDLKLVTALGDHAEFGFGAQQKHTDQFAYEWVDFSFRFPTALGKFSVFFRPLFDKGAQDLGFGWEAGNDSAANQLQVQMIFEDTFNNFWAFRQNKLGNASAPYVKRPYEPTVRYVHRGPSGTPLERVEIGGTWLTHSVRRVQGYNEMHAYDEGLWGALEYGKVEWNALGFGWEVGGHNAQATQTGQPDTLAAFDYTNYRRQWQAEAAVRRRLAPRFRAELRYLYQDRTQDVYTPVGLGQFGAIDRMVVLDTHWGVSENWGLRFGAMHDNISIDRAGPNQPFSWGSRRENRAFVGLTARFGRVLIHAVEGIELDAEPYDVWLVHDKGFIHLQATF